MKFNSFLLALSLLCVVPFAHAETRAIVNNPTAETTSPTNAAQLNLQEGDAFLKRNKTQPNVVTLPSGLQYKILLAGTGPKPTAQDAVTVAYEGKFIDGTTFDSSAQHGGTATFPVGQVIPGWTEALQLMPKGSSWEIYVPSDLAYGAAGAPPTIGPDKTLIFKITLIDIKKAS